MQSRHFMLLLLALSVSWILTDEIVVGKHEIDGSTEEELFQVCDAYCSELNLTDELCALLKEEAQSMMEFPSRYASQNSAMAGTAPSPSPAGGKYSSFTCTAGNQKFLSDWNHVLFEDNAFAPNRVCKLTNVCWANERFYYFRHPEEKHAPAAMKLFDHEFVNLPILTTYNNQGWSINISEDTPIPAELDFLDNHAWFFVYAHYSYNYAHLLMDDLFPIQIAMTLFGIDPANSRIAYTACNKVPAGSDSQNPIWHEQCRNNFETFSRLLWGHKQQPGKDEQIAVAMKEWGRSQGKEKFCLKEVVVGQGHVFGNRKRPVAKGNDSNGGYGVTRSENFPNRYFGISLRQCRDAVVKNLQNPVPDPPSLLRVLIIPKTKSQTSSTLHPDLCQDMTNIVAQLTPAIEVSCLLRGRSVEEEISLVRTFPLIIAEHGTVSYLSIFGHDHTVLISVGHERGMKELDTLSYATHIKVLFTTFDDTTSSSVMAMTQVVRYGLHLAATGFDLSLNAYLTPYN